jgi:2-aminoadipate transaminase
VTDEPPAPSAAERAIARARQVMRQSTLREILALAARPGVISFAVGLPATSLFPAEGLARAAAELLAIDRRALQYGIPYPPLKGQIVELMRLRGVTCRPEQVFLTTGSQQGMDLLVRLLLVPGGRVMLESTVYDGMPMAIKRLEPEILAVPTDLDHGIDVDAVERHLRAGPAPAFLYLITDGHNPLGVSLGEAQRRRLALLARQHRMPILEDDAYGFLYYGEPGESPAPPLRAHEDEWVYYLGSFSKILAPGLRTGWIVAPEALLPTLAALKHGADLDTPSFGQRMISSYLGTGELPGHLARLRAEYRERRDALLAALEGRLAGAVRWNRPLAGMFVWVELPERIDTAELVRTAIEDEKVAFSPGAAFAVQGSRHADHCLRLAFAHLTPAEIAEGVERLARVIERALG